MANEVILRPHHSLCIQFFKGHGYSEEFTENMYRTIERLNQDNPTVTLSRDCDILCQCCPNNENGCCTSDCKVHRIDKNCLEEMQCAFGEQMHWLDLKDLAQSQIIAQNKIGSVCGVCQWRDLCK